MTIPRIILVATDFSEHADRAIDYAADLAAKIDAKLHVVHAISIPALGVPEMGVAYGSMMLESTVKEAQATLDALEARYRDRVSIAGKHLEVGDARDVIDRVAEAVGAELIVMGTHGRRGVRRMLLGSVAEAVVRSAPCPVLTIRSKRP
jgi:nucleotide-binding universal stress UspA family protein